MLFNVPIFMLKALIASLFLPLAVMGSTIIVELRKSSFLVVEVAHAVLAGASLGIVIGHLCGLPVDPTFIALAFALASGALAEFLGERSERESAIGVLFSANMSLAVLFMSVIPPEELTKVWGLLIGDILALTTLDLSLLAVSSVLIASLFILFHKELVYLALDEEGSLALGLRARPLHYLAVLLISLASVFSVKAIGMILVYAILVIPGAVFSRRESSVIKAMDFSALLSLFSLLFALLVSSLAGIPPSGVAGLVLFSTYALFLKLRKKFGSS